MKSHQSSGKGRRPRRRLSSYDEAKDPQFSSASRFLVRVVLGVAAFFCLRLLWLQVFDASRLSAMAESRSTNEMTLHARRGTIYDRDGNILAASEDCTTLYCNPTEIENESLVAGLLAKHLGGEKGSFHEALSAEGSFAYVAHQVDSAKAEDLLSDLSSQGLSGIYGLPDVRRVYPFGDVAGQVLGLVGSEGQGLTGLELMYDDILGGKDGSRVMEVGLGGTPVAGGSYTETPAQDGRDIVISLNIELQKITEETVAEAKETFEAESTMACVIDPHTGEVLSLCSTPLLPAGQAEQATSDAMNVGLLTKSYEPGSVSKIMTTAIGLETGAFDTTTTWEVPATCLVGTSSVSDDDGRKVAEIMDSREILRRSSNVGAVIQGNAIGADPFLRGLKAFGLDSPSGIDLPGESQSLLYEVADWSDSTLGSMAFGQGYSVPPIRIVRATCAIANNGVLTTPHLLVYKGQEKVSWPTGPRACTPQTANQVADLLRTVVDDGTAVEAQIDGFTIAGKTGTAQKADPVNGGYLRDEVYSSFAGFAGVPEADVVAFTAIDGSPYHAGDSAVPMFTTIMKGALKALTLTPQEEETAPEEWGDTTPEEWDEAAAEEWY